MNIWLKRFAPLLILATLLGLGALILSNPPDNQRGGPPTGPQTVVEIFEVPAKDFQVTISSYGTVQPRTKSILVSQVSGQIVSVNPQFKPGGFFAEGETLLQIDARDYEADVKIAEAALMDALQAEAQEAARAEQAMIDWQRLGEADEAPSDLVLRKPQLQAARARVISARSALTKAKLDLERTALTAPFQGRILRQMADVGQVVTTGAQLAEVYATDYVEVRLPIRNADLPFIELPEGPIDAPPKVLIRSDLGGVQSWQGTIVRTEGAIDEVARQLHVVAQINDPFTAAGDGARPLKIGEYVTAQIGGKAMPNALVIPSNAIYQNSYVYTVEAGLLQRKEIEIAWTDGAQSIVARGLNAGDHLVTTPLGQITSGTPVRVTNLPGRDAPAAGSAAGIAQ